MTRLSRIAVCALIGLVVGGGLRAEDPDAASGAMPFAVRDTSPARFAVKEAERLFEFGRTTQAQRLAQEILDGMPDALYRVPSEAASVRWRLAADLVLDMLASQPEADRQRYDRVSQSAAGGILKRAVEQRDPESLTGIADRFAASRAGVEAARHLTDLALEAGRGRLAAHWARRGLRFASEDAGLWCRLVDALGMVGDGAALAEITIPPGVRTDPVGGPDESPQTRLAAWRARFPKPAQPDKGWPMWGGGPRRSASAAATGPRPDTLRWLSRISFPAGDLDEDPFRGGYRNRYAEWREHWERLCPLHAVVAERVLYVSEGRSVRALDVYSGTELWSFDADHVSSLDLLLPSAPSRGRVSLERAYAPAVSGDLVFASVEETHPYEVDQLMMVEISTYLPRRLLVALDRQNGELRWRMGGHPDDASLLERMSVVSPPVVSEGLVVVVAGRHEGGTHRVFLLAFDATTGRLAWQRYVGMGNQELNLFGVPVKELAASAPAVADGTVYASTGLGFVVALELWTGRPRWFASYEIQTIQAVQAWYDAPVRFPRVSASPVVVWGDRLLVAPTDGRHLHAFDRSDGRLKWRVPFPAAPLLGATAHFLGVVSDGRRDVALMTGADLVAFDVNDGERVWLGRLRDEHGSHNIPVGRGAVAGEHVLVPTDSGLARFSLEREGSFEGRDPWPRHVVPGNLLPLPRLLVVTSREAIQAFYSWEEIERDIEMRRRARPDDPLVLFEAGEIYRMGGALERARGAFAEAVELARRQNDAEAERKAARGLYRTCLTEARLAGVEQTVRASRALRRALEWARTPGERVEARLALDTLLVFEPEARAQNLEQLAKEAAGVRAVFPGDEDPVPARAMALLKLAQVRQEQEQPARAIDALQDLLRESGDSSIRGTLAHDLAREQITRIIRASGRAPYRRHEEAARRLLKEARGSPRTDFLTRILREYPNASVVPAALLSKSERLLGDGRADEAADLLRRLLSGHPDVSEAPKAAAVLARAYDVAGLSGARSFVARWLAARHPEASFELDGTRFTGLSFAQATQRPPRLDLPPDPRVIDTPLREVHFEPVTKGAWGRQVDLATSGGAPAPLALLGDGRSLVVFDLVRAKIAFRIEEGSCHRALYSDGILVLALSRELRAVTADTGQPLWTRELGGNLVDLEGVDGQAYVIVRDPRGRGGSRQILALDVTRGHELWQIDLGPRADFGYLHPRGPDLLVRGARRERDRTTQEMLVLDGLTGHTQRVIGLPRQDRSEQEPVWVDDRFVMTLSEREGIRRIAAYGIEAGALAWSAELNGKGRVSGLVPGGIGVVVLRSDGSLGTYDSADGRPDDLTRIYVGEGADAYPLHGTSPLIEGDRLLLMPRVPSPPQIVGAWSRKTGKLLWLTRFDEERLPTRSAMAATRNAVLTLMPYAPRQAPSRVLLRILDIEDGTVRQEIEPMGLTGDFPLLSLAQGWGTVVVFGRAGAVAYASGRGESEEARR